MKVSGICSGFGRGFGIAISLLTLSMLSGCASGPDNESLCATVSGYQMPDESQGLYRAVVTHLNGKPVISRPNYRLAPGEYQFTLAELIDSPRLKVKLAARQTKTLTLHIEANQRYHLAAQFNRDKIYRGLDSDYWQPVVWAQEPHECEFLNESN
ncbi:hypothetical protein L1D40_00095 [Shewanella insulae]|uniref:hypothetical protein n=1 Tax=Shewanella insulae TaxID=2681496 RepID=UPI001EFC879E|nr:hypothetical protein [Shewanella insulae]MCG9714858.1 hypothetical protein [Shewanella insulae]MCG9753625.1 hypothetical protein [Shewanella insulae]